MSGRRSLYHWLNRSLLPMQFEAWCLVAYSSLRFLTLYLHEYHPITNQWEQLSSILFALPNPIFLRELRLCLKLRKPARPNLASIVPSHVLRSIDQLLTGAGGGETCENARSGGLFSRLSRAVFDIQSSLTPLKLTAAEREWFEGLIQSAMLMTFARGILSISFES